MTTPDDDARARWLAALGEVSPAATHAGLPLEACYFPAALTPEYGERLGVPGAFPLTRGIYPGMFRDRLWTIRQYSGFGTPEETNARYRFLL